MVILPALILFAIVVCVFVCLCAETRNNHSSSKEITQRDGRPPIVIENHDAEESPVMPTSSEEIKKLAKQIETTTVLYFKNQQTELRNLASINVYGDSVIIAPNTIAILKDMTESLSKILVQNIVICNTCTISVYPANTSYQRYFEFQVLAKFKFGDRLKIGNSYAQKYLIGSKGIKYVLTDCVLSKIKQAGISLSKARFVVVSDHVVDYSQAHVIVRVEEIV